MTRRFVRSQLLISASAAAVLAVTGASLVGVTADSTTPTGGSSAPGGALPAPSSGWKVKTDDCEDPAKATAKIEGEVRIGSIMPLSGGSAAIAFAPVKDGLDAYIQYANENKLLGDTKISLTIEDDQYNKDLTPGALTKLIDGGANLVTGVIGSPNNAAIRQTLNDNCIPQLNNLTGSPAWGDAAKFPWTTGALVPYDIESKAYAGQIASTFPNGAKVAVFSVNSEFGKAYVEAFKAVAAAAKIEIVDEQTVDPTDTNPPTSQVTSIASKKPDAILAIPLGAGCPTFLKELASAKAANSGWNPPTFITATCASPLILGLAGPAADGLYTSSNLVNVIDPKFQSIAGVKTFLDYMTKLGKADTVSTASTGWVVGEITVHILQEAAKSPEGLTRASIMNAARSIQFRSDLNREGLYYRLDGEADTFMAQSVQVTKYHADTKLFDDIGPLVTQFETK